MGAFAALYFQSRTFSKIPYHPLYEVFAIIGLVLIASAIVFLAHRAVPPFPNAFTLIPTVATLLIVLFGTQETWVGLISYD